MDKKSEVRKIIIYGKEYVPVGTKERVVERVIEVASDNPHMIIGENYFLRTVTHYFTGRLIWVGDKEIAFDCCCWIADTGRFNDFMSKNTYNETEPFPAEKVVIIGRGSIIDMAQHDLIQVIK